MKDNRNNENGQNSKKTDSHLDRLEREILFEEQLVQIEMLAEQIVELRFLQKMERQTVEPNEHEFLHQKIRELERDIRAQL